MERREREREKRKRGKAQKAGRFGRGEEGPKREGKKFSQAMGEGRDLTYFLFYGVYELRSKHNQY